MELQMSFSTNKYNLSNILNLIKIWLKFENEIECRGTHINMYVTDNI